MSLFLTMLPFYLLGNLHCIGMCGPLVLMLGQHRYRFFYFFGRTFSFTLAGMAAGEAGAIFNLLLRHYHIPAVASFLFGGAILLIGIYSLIGLSNPSTEWLGRRFAGLNRFLSLLILRDRAWPIFWFGFFTIILPCGQTVIVFSACALAADAWIGFWNGLAFALLTTPSLLFALRMHQWLGVLKPHYNKVLGCCAVLVGTLAICRGLAELNLIDHWVLNQDYHIVIY